MTQERLTVASFWVHRPDHPRHGESDFRGMLEVLQGSCNRLGVRHVVLTDWDTVPLLPDGMHFHATHLPAELMQAITSAHAGFLESPDKTVPCRDADGDVLFVGADSILLADPRPHLPADADLYVTSRRPSERLDAVNNGFQFIRRGAIERAATLYRRVADRCGTEWRDDQRALVAELAPVPMPLAIEERAGLRVAFLPMKRFNDCPLWPADPCKGAILLHFRGRQRKKLMLAWAKKHGLA